MSATHPSGGQRAFALTLALLLGIGCTGGGEQQLARVLPYAVLLDERVDPLGARWTASRAITATGAPRRIVPGPCPTSSRSH